MRSNKAKNKKMTKKSQNGTLSTSSYSDRKKSPSKEENVLKKMKELLGLNKIRFSPHANSRMGERNIIDYEIRQALSAGKHDVRRDRYSIKWQSWEYSIEGKTIDERHLRVGISFEISNTGERILIITVIDLSK